MAVARVAKDLAGLKAGGPSALSALSSPAASPVASDMAKIVSAQMGRLNEASRVADMDGSGAPAADGTPAGDILTAPKPAPRVFLPRPDHAEAGDTNSSPGKIFSGKGGRDKSVVPGGAVILNADGTRLEIAPPSRPAPSLSARAAKAVAKIPKAELPSLDDPRLSQEERRHRAQLLLVVSVLGAFALIFWARRWRPDV